MDLEEKAGIQEKANMGKNGNGRSESPKTESREKADQNPVKKA